MTPATQQALRRLLFYTAAEAGLHLGHASERAWKYWEAGARSIPADVIERTRATVDWRTRALQTARSVIAEAAARGPVESVPICWYVRAIDWPGEPALWRPHQSVCAALATDTRVVLVPFDIAAFSAWLAGRADSETMRAQWAAEVAC